MTTPSNHVLPIVPGERLRSLDVLRGFALLGILIMNIQSFSMIGAAYINPAAYGDLTGANRWVWILSHLFAAEKFLSIFSMLFGAGVVLMAERIEASGGNAGRVHYRRMLWLLLFGLLHAYLIWYGDILVDYSLCGMLVFLFRRLSPRKLLLAATLFFIVPALLYGTGGLTIRFWTPESSMQTLRSWMPPPEDIALELTAMRGGWLEQMGTRIDQANYLQTIVFFSMMFWRVTSMMLLGMALYKWGVLTAKKTRAWYLRLFTLAFVPGVLIVVYGIQQDFAAAWKMEHAMFLGYAYNYVGGAGIALGYVALVMIAVASGWGTRVQALLGGVGRMAFSNYILMSLLAMSIFYGNGLGLFGRVDRMQQALLVLAIWAVVLVVTPLWLSKFRYGPLEWLWRTLTYWKHQKLAYQ